MKLGIKIFIFLIPLIIFPMSFVGWLAYERLLSGTQNAISRQMNTSVNSVANQVQVKIKQIEANAVVYAQSVQLTNFILTEDEDQRYSIMLAPLLKLFSSYKKAFPEYIEIRFITPDGYEDARLALYSVRNTTEDESNSPVFKEISSSQQPSRTIFFHNPDTRKYNMLVSRMIHLADNEF